MQLEQVFVLELTAYYKFYAYQYSKCLPQKAENQFQFEKTIVKK